MINKKVENFLEQSNMNYMFCLLANIEVQRLNQLPPYVKQKFRKKITETAIEHVANNEIPDYLMDIAEAQAEMERLGLIPSEGGREEFEEVEELETMEEEYGTYNQEYEKEHFEEESEIDDDLNSDND